jgi:hypothetical protein
MILMPKQNFVSFTVKRISQRDATVKDCAKERLDPFKAEPENEDRKSDLLNFCQVLSKQMRKEDRKSSRMVSRYEGKPHSRFNADEKSVLIVCFAWLGLPEMCETVRMSMHDAIEDTVFAELRKPIQRSGGIMHYRSFLTEALSSQDNITYLLEALDALFDPSSDTAHDPEVISWSRQLIQKTVDSYDASRSMIERDASVLMDLCARFGPRIYAERYVAPFA